MKFGEQTKQQAVVEFPKTLKKISKLVGIKVYSYIEYIVCQKCNAVYDHDFSYTIKENQRVHVKCPYTEYPYHPHLSRHKPCGMPLMKISKTRTGKTTIKPYKVSAYQPLEKDITNLINKRIYRCM